MSARKFGFLAVLAALAVVLGQGSALASGGNDDNGNDENEMHMFVRMLGPLPIKATASYEEKAGHTDRDLKVKVEHALPFQNFVVRINGQILGTITTNTFGEGKIRLKDSAAPILSSGTLVTAGVMSGVLMNSADDSGKFYTKVRLRNGTSAEGSVKYIERTMSNGFRRTFSVEVENFIPNDRINIRINGEKVGSVVTNSRGNGEFQLRTPEFIDDPDDGQPMPSTFRPLAPGDRVTVSSLNGIAYVVQ